LSYDFLEGIRVIESSAFIAAPLAGLSLAQMGADVIRIEAIGGGIDYRRMPLMPEGRSIYWTSLNKAKRSIAIDLRNQEGRELVANLVTAPGPAGGVLLTNVAARWLDPAQLAQQRPDLISCIIEGNPDGTTAVDYTINCATGLPQLTGPASAERPVNHLLPAWDVICAQQAANALMGALMRRGTSGKGAALRIALADVAFTTMSNLGYLTEAQLLDQDRFPLGNHIYGAFGRDFATSDGRRVMVAAISSRQWQSLVEACGIKELIGHVEAATGMDFSNEADRFKGRDIIAAFVEHWCQTRTMAEVGAAFDAASVCWGRYQSVREAAMSDPRVSTANPVFERIVTEGIGEHIAAGNVFRLGGATRRPIKPAPMLGSDTDAVLGDVLGLSSGQIGSLHDRGIVAGPEQADPFFKEAAHA
jgi:2-methylfumaryl-CoA isomerase